MTTSLSLFPFACKHFVRLKKLPRTNLATSNVAMDIIFKTKKKPFVLFVYLFSDKIGSLRLGSLCLSVFVAINSLFCHYILSILK